MAQPIIPPDLREKPRRLVNSDVCAGHGALLRRCKSYGQVFAEPKARRTARASSRGGVWRKPNPRLRGDEQKPDMRRGASGTSGHVPAKPSICGWDAF